MATIVAPAAPVSSPRTKSRFGRFLVFALLVIATLFYLAPVYVMVINGLKDKSYMTLSGMWNLPLYLNGGGFPVAWDVLNPSLWASLRMVIPATIGSSLWER
jgi:glucose/mannose transport system permease protein